MRFDTPLTRLLDIEIPIIQGPMAWLSEPELVSAVSNEGGLGVLGASLYTAEEFEERVQRTLELTRRPFGVNFPLVLMEYDAHLEVALKHGVRIIVTSAGSPKRYTPRVKQAGALCIHVVPSLKHAVAAVDAGVDAVVLESIEAGGHISGEGLTGFTNIPHARAGVKVPLVAAGGIVDGRGMAAAMALGADGVQMGTRFLATTEGNAHPRYKQMLLDAGEHDTPVHSKQHHPGRALRTPVVEKLLEMERGLRPPEEIRQVIGRGRARKAAEHGNLEEGLFFAGAGASLVRDIIPVRELMRRTLAEYDQAVAHLRNLAGLR
ncbi:MAG: nitronate monooxygenase [Deltaproteobacteria bacterium]|nr:nitronate monooxygenase [Deltaproteobacteria bacterium]